MDYAKISAASSKYPPAPDFSPAYGTAGFRADASLLDSTVFRCGLLAAARSMAADKVTGMMVTASHNPVNDNGVKLVEPSGEMLVPAWEAYVTQLAQAQSDELVVDALKELLSKEECQGKAAGTVYIGYDTRPSADRLVAAAVAGVEAMGATAVNCGLQTTPILHFRIRSFNMGGKGDAEEYYATLGGAYQRLAAGQHDIGTLYIDCANGVGAAMARPLADSIGKGLSVQLKNTGDGTLNLNCGSDFVQKEKRLPECFEDVPNRARCCSVDGDADRIVFYTQKDGKFTLFDGDKIATLAALYINGLVTQIPQFEGKGFTYGVVQTAYANGASTKYLTETVKINVAITKTGVKHLHHEAVNYDVGIYFEANGHGTVLFSERFIAATKEVKDSPAGGELMNLIEVINQAVGDAFSGVLMVEAILRRKHLSLKAWEDLYTDLPSRQMKVKVADRSAIQTTNAERQCTAPPGLQEAVDAAVARHKGGRSFVRASGTEDIVRVYAEAATQEGCDSLTLEVMQQVYKIAGGVGSEPTL